MSANAFGSDWAQLEAGTFRFRDPLERERRLIPLRLDDSPIKGSLAQSLCINWRLADREQDYAKLLEAWWPRTKPRERHYSHLGGSAFTAETNIESPCVLRQSECIVTFRHFRPPTNN
jgi:hypothetical protein